MKKLLCYYLLVMLLVSPSVLFFPPPIVEAGDGGLPPLGYELLDAGSVFHMWNRFDHYYFNTSSGIQLTNHYQEYWTHNVMMLGYYADSDWHILYRTDELSGFNKQVESDNSTYVNATIWKDLSYGPFDFRLAIRYCLGVDDHNLTVIPYIKNLGDPILYDLGFGWEIRDIQINMESDDNWFHTWNYSVDLSTPGLNEWFTSDTNGTFVLDRNNYYLYLNWDENLDYYLWVNSRANQSNAPVTLFIRTGGLAAGQEKSTKLYWYDSALTLRPNSDGAVTNWSPTGAVAHYDCVDEAVKDDLTTYIAYGSATYVVDMLGLPDHTTETGNIKNVSIYAYAKSPGDGGKIKLGYYWNSSYHNSSEFTTTTSWVLYSYRNATRSDGKAWNWTNVDDLVLCLWGRRPTSPKSPQITQAWVEVNYWPSISVTTNETTWVNETGVNLSGWVENDDGEVCSCWIQYRENGSSTWINTPKTHNLNTGDSFYVNLSNLSAGREYQWRSAANHSSDTQYGPIKTFWTLPNATTGLLVRPIDQSNNSLYITWAKNGNGDQCHFVLVRNETGWSGTPTTPSNGTVVYNDTGTSCWDTGLWYGTNYSYAIWGYVPYNYSSSNQSAYNLTLPQPPYGVASVLITTTSLNITWHTGNGSDSTLVRRDIGSYPSDAGDGTQCYNGSLEYNVTDLDFNYFFGLWSYNATLNMFSPGVDLVFGGLRINCYNESNPSQNVSFDIEITNGNVSQTYTNSGCTNTHVVDFAVAGCPSGYDVVIYITNSSYKGRTYVMDLFAGVWYNLSAYLPPLEIPGGGGPGGDSNITRIYRVEVIDDYGAPVQGALVSIKRYINTTGSYDLVANAVTDSYGQCDVYLIPETHYKVVIEKDGYLQEDPIPDWFPDPIFYGANYPKSFRLTMDRSSATWPHIWDVIDVDVEKFINGSMVIQFENLEDGFQNIQFYTYEYYNGTLSLNATNTSVISPRTFWIYGLNSSRLHHVVIHLNHTGMIDNYETVTLFVQPIRSPTYNRNNINSIVNLIIGPPPTGTWVDWVIVLIPALFLLVCFGPGNPEIGIAFSCLWLGIVSLFVSVPDTLVLFAPVGLVIAGIVKYVKKSGVSI